MPARFAGSWRTSRALESFRELLKVIEHLTEEEVYYCLKLESESQRRKSVMDRLVSEAAKFNQQHFIKSLKEKINGSPEINHPVVS